MPVYAEKTILDLEKIYINGEKRGYLMGISPQALPAILKIVLVEMGISG